MGLGANWAAPHRSPAGGHSGTRQIQAFSSVGGPPLPALLSPFSASNVGSRQGVTAPWRVNSELSSIHLPKTRAWGGEKGLPHSQGQGISLGWG